MSEQDQVIRIRIKNARLSFPALWEAKAAAPGATPKFGATFLLPKDDPQVKTLSDAISQAIKDQWKGKLKASNLKGICLRDGVEKDHLDGYGEGTVFISANSRSRVPVVGPKKVDGKFPVLDESDNLVYAGCYVNATIRLWCQDNEFGKRVNADLRAVQFVRDGEPFGAGPVAAEEEFDEVDIDEADAGSDDDSDDILG